MNYKPIPSTALPREGFLNFSLAHLSFSKKGDEKMGWSALYMVGVLGILAVITVSTPFVLNELENRINVTSTATPQVKVIKADVQKAGPNSYQLTIVSSAPASGYVVYKDNDSGLTKTILSVYGAEKANTHIFKIDNTSGGEATIMLNGVNTNPEEKPIQIK